MGKEYGLLSRFVLSFDLTFLALLSLGLQSESDAVDFAPHRCVFPPFQKKVCPQSCPELSTISALAMLLFYYKVKDNQRDGGRRQRLAAGALLPVASLARRKARRVVPELDAVMATCMAEDAMLSAAGCDGIDAAAEPTAKALSLITASLATTKTDRLILARLGYLIGKYVYLIDATDDWEQDGKTGDYNVFVEKFQDDRDAILAAATQVLNLTVAEIASTYGLLSVHRFAPILDNIIYMGLHHSIHLVTASGDSSPHSTDPMRERSSYDRSI